MSALDTASQLEFEIEPLATLDLAALIPAWEPEPALTSLVRRLLENGFREVIVVDDGSNQESQPIFNALTLIRHVHVVRHAVNLGKGRALKTGINYFLNRFPELRGLVTADADGQHDPDDILHASVTFLDAPNKVVLGARAFSSDVPLRSRFGNLVTRQVFQLLTGRKLTDTQTGLRVFPAAVLPELLRLDGERYEYEMTVLATICRNAKPLEVPIRTIYIDGNRSSHFDPIRDSMRVYFVLIRFYFSSLFAAAIDLIGFSLAMWTTGNIAISVAAGRLSSIANFALNKKFVFNSAIPVRSALIRYYLLATVLAAASYGAIHTLARFRWNIFVAKLVVETTLSLVSFSMQRTFVFGRRTQTDV